MPPAAAAGIGLASAGLQAYGARQQMKNAQQQLSPQQILYMMQQFNPGLYAALTGGDMGQYRGTQYEQIANIANNPGYIDPRLMNAPMQQSAQRGQSDLIAAQGMIGRSGAGGGLANAYALANKAAQTQRDVGTQQQYTLWREQQRRQDLDWLQQMYSGLMGQATGTATQMAGIQGAMPTWAGMAGNALGSGLGVYGMMRPPQANEPPGGWASNNAGGWGSPDVTPYRQNPGIAPNQGGGFMGGGYPAPTYPTGPVGLYRQ